MKYYKSFILFSLFALAFVSCNTDDLERDIDALKDRVTNVEAQVQQLNDVSHIAEDAFENTPDVVIFASVGSYAWQWAEKQGIPHGTPYTE